MMIPRFRAITLALCLISTLPAGAQTLAEPPTTSSPPGIQSAQVPGSDKAKPAEDQSRATGEMSVLNPTESPQNQKPGGNRADGSDGVGANKGEHESYERTIANFTIALAVATFLLMIATGGLWWETRKLAKQALQASKDSKEAISIAGNSLSLSEKTSRKEFRAYVRLRFRSAHLKPGDFISFDVGAYNYGRTPANNLAIAGTAIVRAVGYNWEGPNVMPDGERPRQTLHPGDNTFITDFSSNERLPQHVYDAVMAGGAVIYVRGLAVYDDIFGEKHETLISFEYSGDECVRRNAPRISSEGNIAS